MKNKYLPYIFASLVATICCTSTTSSTYHRMVRKETIECPDIQSDSLLELSELWAATVLTNPFCWVSFIDQDKGVLHLVYSQLYEVKGQCMTLQSNLRIEVLEGEAKLSFYEPRYSQMNTGGIRMSSTAGPAIPRQFYVPVWRSWGKLTKDYRSFIRRNRK